MQECLTQFSPKLPYKAERINFALSIPGHRLCLHTGQVFIYNTNHAGVKILNNIFADCGFQMAVADAAVVGEEDVSSACHYGFLSEQEFGVKIDAAGYDRDYADAFLSGCFDGVEKYRFIFLFIMGWRVTGQYITKF